MASYKIEVLVNGTVKKTLTRKHADGVKDISSLSFSLRDQFTKDDKIKVKLTVIDGDKEYEIKEGKLNVEKIRI